MQTVETEAPATTVVVIEPSAAQTDLDWMIGQVKAGLWCQGALHDGDRSCTVGLVARVRPLT